MTAPFTPPLGGLRAELEWPCRLAGANGRCPICSSHGDTEGDKAHRRAVLQAATQRRPK